MALLLLLSALSGCEDGEPASTPTPRGTSGAEAASTAPPGRVFQRNVVFLATEEDSLIGVPWLLRTRSHPGGEVREARGLLAHGSSWDVFFAERWTSTSVRAPWRILPHGPMRIVVGDGGALERLFYESGDRRLEVVLGETRAEITGQRAETIRLLRGALELGGRRTSGVVMDMSWSRRENESELGDWLFATSGDSVEVVLYRPVRGVPGEPDAWRGWLRTGEGTNRLPRLAARWDERRAFEAARREVPVRWTFVSEIGEARVPGSADTAGPPASGDAEDGVVARLDVTAAHLEADEAEGEAQPPVDALFVVEGTLAFEGRSWEIRGVIRHRQG